MKQDQLVRDRPGIRRRAVLGGIAALPFLAAGSRAQDAATYPERPVRIVVPNPPGGGSDIMSRVLSQELQTRLGQPFPVENRSGSNGIIGLDNVAKSRPAGYSLIVGTVSQYLCNPFVYRSIPYDLDTDFAPVGLTWEYCNVAAVPTAHVPARTMAEFVEWGRSQREGVTYGSNGIATSPHLLGSLFMQSTGITGVHVPFRGGAETVASMLRGDTQFTMTDAASLGPYIRQGSLTALAVTAGARWHSLPEVPTMAEVGMPQLEATIWTGICAAAGTSQAAVDKLSGTMAAILSEKGVQERIRTAGASPLIPNPARMSALIKVERPRWGEMVRLADARLD
jgi:tripartite-type tricarboxylate transporter receptor subunit TctC